MNKQHRWIKFTSETEQNKTFSFLDINITHQNNQIKASFYRKPTFTGVFTHYESYIDQSYKKLLIFTLLSRCYSICPDQTLFYLEVEKLREILKKNIYPSGIITQSPWRVISCHFPQKVWPSKHIKNCKRNEIHLVSSPKFGGIGPWDLANLAHFRIYFNQSHASHFQFMMLRTKLINYVAYQNF